MTMRGVSSNCKYSCVSVPSTLTYTGQNSHCLGNDIEIHEYRFVLRLLQFFRNAVNCGATLCRDPEFPTNTCEISHQPRVRRNQESSNLRCIYHFLPPANSRRLRPACFAAYSAASASLIS